MEGWLYIVFLILAIVVGFVPGGNFLYLFGMAVLFDAWGEPMTSVLGLWVVGTVLAVVNEGILIVWGGLFFAGWIGLLSTSTLLGLGVAIRYRRTKDDITRKCITLLGHDVCIGRKD